MLRYYDEHGLLRPQCVDPATRYRMYSARQVERVRRINMLRALDFSVADMKEMLENWQDAAIISKLQENIAATKAAIRESERRMETMERMIEDTKRNVSALQYAVTIKSVPEYRVISLRRRVPDYFCEGSLWETLYDFVCKNHVEIDRRRCGNIAIYHDTEDETAVDIETALVLKGTFSGSGEFVSRTLEKVETMASMMVYGPYDRIAEAYRSFIFWLEAHPEYEMDGLSRQVCVIDAGDGVPPSEYLTEIQIPVKIRS